MAELTSELEDLDTLLSSSGWKRMKAKFETQWGRAGNRYLDLVEKMANTTDREKAADEIQRVIWVRKELEAFFAGIESDYQRLKNAHVPTQAGQSRRGVL